MSIKTTKLIQASTIVCTSSAMLEQHGLTRSTRSSRLTRHIERVESCRDVTWRAKWNLGLCQFCAQLSGMDVGLPCARSMVDRCLLCG